MGSLIEPAQGKLLAALTSLEAGQSWSPGVVTGVARGSRTHLTEYFGPVLIVITASTFDEAIGIQDDGDYGLTPGLHSLLARPVQAGNLYVNRGTTGASCSASPSAAGRSPQWVRARRPAARTT